MNTYHGFGVYVRRIDLTNIGVFVLDECVRKFNELSDDYAHTNASTYAQWVARERKQTKGK